jgi:DNA-3-methyladenine glycosylase II
MPRSSRAPVSAFQAHVPVAAPYRLDLTVAVLRRLSSNVVDRLEPDGTYRRALDGFAAPLLASVRQCEPGALAVTLDAMPGEEERGLALVRRILGVDRRLDAWDRSAAKVPWLRGLAQRMRGVKPPRYPTLWETCVNAIIFQQISLIAAGAIMRRTIEALGSAVEAGGAVLYAFPSAAVVADAPEAVLRGAGLSGAKIAALRAIATALLEGRLDEAMLEERSSVEAAELLCTLRGIGPWTAALILLRGLGRLDVFPINDSGAARSLALLSGGKEVDLEAALRTLGAQRGLLYYHLLLARLEARGELAQSD